MSTTDTVPSLTPNQILALVVLMAEARELSNSELKELAGFALTGADNSKLVNLGLVETDRSHRPFSHQLTDKGWRVVRELPSATPPRQGGSAIRSLVSVLANVQRSLDRLQISQADFFKQTADPTAETATTRVGGDSMPLLPGNVEASIRAVYEAMAKAPGEWVGLADLRERLPGLDRTTVDDALRGMVHKEGVRIIPVANSKALQARDRAAALRIGDEDNHALSIGPA